MSGFRVVDRPRPAHRYTPASAASRRLHPRNAKAAPTRRWAPPRSGKA